MLRITAFCRDMRFSKRWIKALSLSLLAIVSWSIVLGYRNYSSIGPDRAEWAGKIASWREGAIQPCGCSLDFQKKVSH